MTVTGLRSPQGKTTTEKRPHLVPAGEGGKENIMNALIPFDYEGTSIRVLTGEDGQPWFVARDVCDVLGMANPRSSLALLDEDEKGVHSVDILGGVQEMTVISEPGLYSLILRSRKAGARAFKRWVTHEVLPSIRKRGGMCATFDASGEMIEGDGHERGEAQAVGCCAQDQRGDAGASRPYAGGGCGSCCGCSGGDGCGDCARGDRPGCRGASQHPLSPFEGREELAQPMGCMA